MTSSSVAFPASPRRAAAIWSAFADMCGNVAAAEGYGGEGKAGPVNVLVIDSIEQPGDN